MGWGLGAEEIYDAVRDGIAGETDDRKRELFWRSPEKMVRIATSIAAGCLSKTVDRDHMEWAHQFVMRSEETLLAGIEEHMEEEKLEFAELCKEIMRRVRQWGGKMTKRDIGRSFQNNVVYAHHIWNAVDHLVNTEQLLEWRNASTGGRPSIWYSLPERKM
jgi:DNA replicative helicase MCM subunit Mcm2 (Cdc46/Mcm family)